MATDKAKQSTGADTIKALTTHRAALAEAPAPVAGQPSTGEPVSQIDLNLLDDNPDQPRAWVDPDHLEELAASILSRGTRQPDFPILARPGLDGRYFVIAGHCRRDAKKLLRDRAAVEERSAWCTISALVRPGVDDETSAIMALDENIKRRDLTPVEEGASYANLLQRYPGRFPSKKALAKQLGIEETRVQRMIRLHEGPGFLRDAILKGILVAASDQEGAQLDEAGSPGRSRQVRRRLDFKAALEFLRLYEHLARKESKNPIRAEEKAAERTGQLIARALEEGWSFRKIDEHCAALVAGKPPTAAAVEKGGEKVAPIVERQGGKLVIYLDRFAKLAADARATAQVEVAELLINLPPATDEAAGGHVAASDT